MSKVQCDNCGRTVNEEDTHTCGECRAILCGWCVCEVCPESADAQREMHEKES